MELSLERHDTESLAELSRAGVQLLLAGSFDQLGAQFGYAVAFDRPVTDAIAADFSLALGETRVRHTASLHLEEPTVVRYAPNAPGLIAAVSIVLSDEGLPKIAVDFVVAGQLDKVFMSLEQISSCVTT